MEIGIFFGVLIGWLIVLSPVLIYALVIERRRRDNAAEFQEKIAAFQRQIDILERRTRVPAEPVHVAQSAGAVAPTAEPVVRIIFREAPAAAPVTTERPPFPQPASPPVPTQPSVPAKPTAPVDRAALAAPPFGVPASGPTPPVAPSPVVVPLPLTTSVPPPPPVQSQPKVVEVGGIPVTPRPQPVEPVKPMPPAPHVAAASPPSPSSSSLPPSPPPAQWTAPSASASHTTRSTMPAEKKSISLEERLGISWAATIGTVVVVVGVVSYTAIKWKDMSAGLHVTLLYLLGAGMLALGVFLERKDLYKILGRVLIGGGWAITFFITWAINHLEAARVLHSAPVDIALLLGVAVAMVWHTLKYDSQTVTATAFLLAFFSIGYKGDTALSVAAGAILAAGLSWIVVRRRWYQLEIFGILAAYLNHFFWVYPIIDAMAGHKVPFPEYWPSAILLVVYWAIFRTAYLLHKISYKEEEAVSTIAALLNPLLLLGLLKYQSVHPELAFYALLVLGVLEFGLGQLPVARARKAPFQVLSCLGALLMVVAVPFKYSGNSLDMLWLAGAEAFLLAGIFTRERLFRGFGLIISFLVALHAIPVRIAPLVAEILNGQPHYHVQVSIVLAVIAVALYANAHVVRRIWPDLFRDEPEQTSGSVLSFMASISAVAAVYAFAGDNKIAIVLALLVIVLSFLGKQFSIDELVYQAHWIAVVAAVQVIVIGRTLETQWHGVPERILTFAPVAALLYVSSRFVRSSNTNSKAVFAAAYGWAATSLLTIMIWFQSPDWCMTLLWLGLALALSLVAGALQRTDFKWQAFALALLSFGRAVAVNFDLTNIFFLHLTYRLISVSATAGGIYVLARWAPLKQLRPIYSFSGTFLLAVLAFKEVPEPWIAVAWAILAICLSLAARLWKDRALLWQTHILSALATGWTLYASFAPQYKDSRVQLISVVITAAVLYVQNWVTNIKDVIEDERISQAYSWAGSLLVSWLLWYRLEPVSVCLAWAVFGMLLFEIGNWRSWAFLRLQAYVALMCSFAHIFYANFNVPRSPGTLGAAAIDVMILSPIYFFVYWRLHGKTTDASAVESKIRVEYLLSWLGTATLVALARFELSLEAVVVGYAAIVLGTLLAAWLMRLRVFLYQALVVLGFAAFRISTHNFFRLEEAFSSSLSSSIWAILLLAACVPVSFAMRQTSGEPGKGPRWAAFLARHPEQPLFFVPAILTAVLIALKASGPKITFEWAAEAVLIILVGFFVRERSYVRSGLGLLLICPVKVLAMDMWKIHDTGARALFVVGIGAMLMLGSFLFARNRETLRKFL